ncbi:unnamed protein product [Rotaria sp. Silwood1]|nr:unnamed protein product [Rotaria sp. Silwood1]CAF1478584.1 unnamed protein product [Rotaria sp. Silwood1]CAF3613958.1 unnamed protein product [Rotaria sp. Silwood1]CAF4770439.1 unnamed protein product [Rotaria sp. Silwood1]CAF4807530.1 unnamed protein product [Rotaria sp. Silwood1]
MADAKIDMALDDIIKKSRNGPGNRRGRGRGGNQNQRRGGRISKNNTNNNRGRGGNFRRGGGGRNSFNQRNNNRSNNFRQQRGRGNRIPGFNRRSIGGDKPTATYNPLSRDVNPATSKQQQQQNLTTPRKQQGSIFNKMRTNQNVGALRRRMVAAQRALNRATKTLATLPRIKQQRQRFLQQPQKLRNIITRARVGGGAVRKRLTNARKPIGRGGARRMFV